MSLSEHAAELDRLQNEERKLLRAHYEDRVSEQLFTEEEVRIRAERAAAEETVSRLNGEYDLALTNLDRALEYTADIQAAYDRAPKHVRRLFNQAFFEKLLVLDDDIDGHVLAEPFAQLLAEDLPAILISATTGDDRPVSAAATPGPETDRTSDLVLVEGSISRKLVELAGLLSNPRGPGSVVPVVRP